MKDLSYNDEDLELPLKEVRTILRDNFGFRASARMIKARMKQWGFFQGIHPDDWLSLAILDESTNDFSGRKDHGDGRIYPTPMDGMSKFAAKAAGIADTHAVTISDEGARFVGKRPLSPKNNTISITELLDRMKKRASMDSNDDSQALLMATLMLGHKMTFTTWSDLAQLVHAGQHYIASESFCDIDGELHDDIPIQGPRAMESCCESYAFEKNKLVAEHEKSVEQFAFNLKSDLLKVLPAEETISPQPMPAPQSTLRPPHTFSHCLTIDSPVENTGSGPYASRSACEYTNACGAVAISGEQQTNIADPAERRRIKNPIAQHSYRKKLKRRPEDHKRKTVAASETSKLETPNMEPAVSKSQHTKRDESKCRNYAETNLHDNASAVLGDQYVSNNYYINSDMHTAYTNHEYWQSNHDYNICHDNIFWTQRHQQVTNWPATTPHYGWTNIIGNNIGSIVSSTMRHIMPLLRMQLQGVACWPMSAHML
ncbi:hypothetical protein PMZ80_010152 [Knufia obscura]|uniref:Clr5 domain-containing protein n=2 Tax=Knufia TaxID=430999 RepID=A0AAN8I3M6_9EURO|nr:hypothetical protein PMZ80_010152 [Knufia obscura]KAK5952892.1 hypothetical protein OHC33_006013 [Knufia fluminis]